MRRFRYLKDKEPDATIHCVVRPDVRQKMERLAVAKEMPLGRVAGEALAAYVERPDNKEILKEK